MLAARELARLKLRAALRDAEGDQALAAVLVSRWVAHHLVLPPEDEAELKLRLILSSLPSPATSSARDAPGAGGPEPATVQTTTEMAQASRGSTVTAGSVVTVPQQRDSRPAPTMGVEL